MTDTSDRDRKEELLAMQNEYLPGSAEHGTLTGGVAAMIGIELGLSEDEIQALETAAALHDIGKCTVPVELLQKNGPLSEKEMQIMRTHALNGHSLLAKHGMPEAAETALRHHEHFDGGGYPDGLSGNNIPLFARITAVADTFIVLHYGRPYRQPVTRLEALKEILGNAGTQFDPGVTKAMERVVEALEESEN